MKSSKWIFSFLFCLLLFRVGMAQESTSLTEIFQTGVKLMEEKQFQQAIPLFEQIIAQTNSDDLLFNAKASQRLAYCQTFTGQMDKALVTYRTAYELAQEVEDPRLLIETSSGLAEIYGMRKQANLALPYLWVNNKYSLQIEDWYVYSNSLSTIGNAYIELGQLDSARWYVERGLAVKVEHNIEKNLYYNYFHLASFYEKSNDYELAVEYHLRIIEILEKDNESSNLAIEYHNLSRMFLAQNNIERAQEYCTKAIALCQELNLVLYHSSALSTNAKIKELQGQNDEALQLYQEALQLNRNTQNEGAILSRLNSLIKLHLKLEQYEIAENHLTEVLPLVQQRNNLPEKTEAYLNLAKLKIGQNKLPEAKNILDSAQAMVMTLDNIKEERKWLATQSEYFEKNGEFNKALLAGQQAASLKDSIFNIEKSERIHELEEKFERTKKEKEITLLNAEKEIKDFTLQQNQRNTFVSLIGLLLACGMLTLLYYLNRLRRKTNERLAEKNSFIATALAEKEILLKEIHHRVKNNLQVVSSLLRMQTEFIKDPKALDAMQEGRNRVKSMAMIHQNLYQEDNLVGVSVQDYIQKLSESLFHSYNVDANRIQLETHIDQLNLDVDTIIPLGLILNELLTNALKYAFPNETKGKVAVTLKEEKEYLLLEVKDNGVGIDPSGNSSDQDGGFGIKLIDTFAIKLNAQRQILQEDGTIVRLLIHKYKIA